jgi:hypothetical protein
VAFNEAGQFIKVCSLVQHYYAHRAEKSSESVVDFLNDHYWNGHKADGDEEEDKRLPFKRFDSPTPSFTFDLPPIGIFSSADFSSSGIHNLYHAVQNIAEPLTAVFHPPQEEVPPVVLDKSLYP